MVWRNAGLVILGMIGAGTAFAQPAGDAAVCLDHEGPTTPQTAACARLIDAGAGKLAERDQFHVERGWAVDDDAAAIAGLTPAIALDPQNAEAFAALRRSGGAVTHSRAGRAHQTRNLAAREPTTTEVKEVLR